jgi:hypothetical protein
MSTHHTLSSEILNALDNCDKDSDFNFPNLEHPYVYMADCRLNLFRDDEGHWAIASEILGYNTRGAGWAVALEIRYFGNCLHPPEDQDAQYNYYNVFPLDSDSFNDTIDIEILQPDATTWIVRGVDVLLSHDKTEYEAEGVTLKEFEPGTIAGEEVLRFMVARHHPLFRATDDELYRWLPSTLKKILVLDEWHHKSFHQMRSPFEDPQILTRFDQDNPMIAAMIQEELGKSRHWNAAQWENRPSTYETWQQIARILATGDTTIYNPSLASNTHWKNWPEGGSL